MNTSLKMIIVPTIALSLIAMLQTSCSKSDSNGAENLSTALVQVSLAGATYDSEETIGNRAATPTEVATQRSTIALNEDFLMVAELRPEEQMTSLKDKGKAAIEVTDLAQNIRYRLLVYNQSGAFVTERDYIRGSEASTPELKLDHGTTYTFVAISLNNSNTLAATSPAIATRTLDNSQIAVTGGTTQLMYYKHTMTVTATDINRLDIIFKNKKPYINTTINSSQTGYNITAVTANLSPHNNAMLVRLSDGSHTRTGSAVNAAPAFAPLNTQIVTGGTSINAADNNTTTFTISNITIGTITATNLVPFNNLNVTAGVRYNLIINIVPNDANITHQGQDAVRINGQIWMKRNLGASTTLNPDVAPFNNLIGNFYQWGSSAVVATGTTAAGAISGWSNNYTGIPANRWNLGSEASPTKNTSFDPCPSGFRVPSLAEMTTLLNSTRHSDIGNFSTVDPLGTAKVLTSPRNANAKLTFPLAGNRNWNNGAREVRAVSGYFWSSTPVNTDARHYGFHQGLENIGESVKAWGFNIRCIAQ